MIDLTMSVYAQTISACQAPEIRAPRGAVWVEAGGLQLDGIDHKAGEGFNVPAVASTKLRTLEKAEFLSFELSANSFVSPASIGREVVMAGPCQINPGPHFLRLDQISFSPGQTWLQLNFLLPFGSAIMPGPIVVRNPA